MSPLQIWKRGWGWFCEGRAAEPGPQQSPSTLLCRLTRRSAPRHFGFVLHNSTAAVAVGASPVRADCIDGQSSEPRIER